MTNKQKIDNLLDMTGLYMMKEYGLDVLHVLEKMMGASITQDFYDGKKNIEDMTPEELGDYYLSL